MTKKKINDGSVPEHVLNQLNEHTLGGFVLFYFNSETGEPEQMLTFDSPAHSLGLQKHIADWCEAVHEVNLENSVMNIQHNLMENFREENGLDDENED